MSSEPATISRNSAGRITVAPTGMVRQTNSAITEQIRGMQEVYPTRPCRSAIASTASAARLLAPRVPSLAVTSRRSRRMALRVLDVGQHPHGFRCDSGRREGILDQLRNDATSGHQVRHGIGLNADERLSQPVGHRRQTVDNCHRACRAAPPAPLSFRLPLPPRPTLPARRRRALRPPQSTVCAQARW